METQEKITFNLVYEFWENDTPIPNGNVLFPEKDFQGDYFFLKNSGYEVTSNNLKNVYDNPDKLYFFFINHIYGNIHEFFGNKNILSEEVVKCSRHCNNFKIVFLTIHESDNLHSLKIIENFSLQNKIKTENIYVINNNSKLYEIQKKLNTNINVHNIDVLPFITSCAFSEYGCCNFIENKNDKFFMTFTRNPKLHRFSLLCFLKKNNILDNTNWSYIAENKRQFDIENINLLLDDFNLYKNEIDYFDNLKLKRSDYENDLNFLSENNLIEMREKYNFLGHGIPELSVNYENSYVNITTESIFFDDSDVVQITEKSIKPFFYYQIPLIVATPSHSKYLKEKYDFDLFEDLIDLSFDSETNHTKRFKLILKEIEKLNINKDKVRKFYKKNKDRFLENSYKALNNISIENDRVFFTKLASNV